MATNILYLDILLYGQKIGTMSLLPGESSFFAFDSAYIDDLNRPTLSLSFQDKLGNFIESTKPTRTKLSPFFSNLLPEGELREYLALKAGVNTNREFFLLLALGKDLPGAITVSGDIKLLNNDKITQVKKTNTDFMRFSLAGVFLKFSGIMRAKSGLTIPANGMGGNWIIKLPSLRYQNIPENEFSMMCLAKMMAIDVPEIMLVDIDKISGLPEQVSNLKGQALAVKRFDRDNLGNKIHQEDFAQIFSLYPDEKYCKGNYKNIAEVIMGNIGEKAVMEFIRRLVFCTLIGNADMHMKNWSLIYPDKINPALASAYDLLSTIVYIKDDTMALNFVKSKKMQDLSIDLLSYLSLKANLPLKEVINTAKETVEKFHHFWHQEKNNFTLDNKTIDIISNNAKNIKLYQEVLG